MCTLKYELITKYETMISITYMTQHKLNYAGTKRLKFG